MKTIKGRFEIKSTPLEADDSTKKVGAVRMKFEKQFSGAMVGSSTVAFLGILDQANSSGGYVGLELFEGTVEERQGSFHLQHSCTMLRGKQEQSITVVPESGRGELAGITGRMTIEIKDKGEHFYSFDYSFS